MTSLTRVAAPALLLALTGPTLVACSADESAEPGGATSPLASSSAPTPEPSESPTEEPTAVPTEELGGPTLDQDGVLLTLPSGFRPDREGLTTQKSSLGPDDQYASISTLGTVQVLPREDLVQRLLERSGFIGRPTVAEEDVELDGIPFVNVFGRWDLERDQRLDYFAATTDKLDISITLTTPLDWSEEERDAYLQPIFDAVVIP